MKCSSVTYLGPQLVDGDGPSDKQQVERFVIDVDSSGCACFTLEDGRVLRVILTPAAVAAGVKAAIAARVAVDEWPTIEQLEAMGAVDSVAKWSGS